MKNKVPSNAFKFIYGNIEIADILQLRTYLWLPFNGHGSVPVASLSEATTINNVFPK